MYFKSLLLFCVCLLLLAESSFAQYDNLIRDQIQIEKSLPKYKKVNKSNQAPPSTYHQLMGNMEERIKAKGGTVSDVSLYPNGAEAYKARVKQYYALNPTQDEIENDISSVISGNSANKKVNEYDPAESMASNINIPKPKIQKPQEVSNNVNEVFFPENNKPDTSSDNPNFAVPSSKPSQTQIDSVTEGVSANVLQADKPQSSIYTDSNNTADVSAVYQEVDNAEKTKPAYNAYANKPVEDNIDKALATGHSTAKIVGDTLKEQQANIYIDEDVIAAVDTVKNSIEVAQNAKALENKAEGAGVLYGSLTVLSEFAEDVFGPLGNLVAPIFETGAQVTKKGVETVDEYNVKTMQGEAQGLKNASVNKQLFEFLKQSGQEYSKHNYTEGYQISFSDAEGNIESVNMDAVGATKVNLGGEEYYLFTTTDGEIAQTLIKIEDEPFWKFWKSDKAKVYTAKVSGDIESGSYLIEDANLIGETAIK